MFAKSFSTFCILVATLLSIVPSTSAIISNFVAPTQALHYGETFNVTFTTEDYIQYAPQYYVVFGIWKGGPAPGGGLGDLLGTGFDLVAAGESNTGYTVFNVTLQLPQFAYDASGLWLLTAAVFGTAGAAQGTVVNNWTANITLSNS